MYCKICKKWLGYLESAWDSGGGEQIYCTKKCYKICKGKQDGSVFKMKKNIALRLLKDLNMGLQNDELSEDYFLTCLLNYETIEVE